jgi:DNA-directed RNA polymerase specialized sigma24 family protein
MSSALFEPQTKKQDKEIAMAIQYAEESIGRIDPAAEWAFKENREVLGRLFSHCTNQLYGIAYKVLGSREEAEDAVQDGLLSAVQNLKSFEGRSKLSTWLTRVVINAALDATAENARIHHLLT